MIASRDYLHKVIDNLSDESLEELGQFIAFLHFKEQRGSSWVKSLYDLYTPVRAAAEDMSDDEIDALIDTAIDEVRRG
ncbi:MAG: hypothetical protein KC615_12190 [Anaerolineae bacterium]|nr:hypothetical protein [Anaerolineae bacterium]MCB9460902.1 hypothetical protein [Anaerolineaceae bacterium]